MKYLLYFHFYILSQGDTMDIKPNFTTTISVKNDSIRFYAYPIGYFKWKIEHVHRESINRLDNNRYSVNAIYSISLEDIKAIVYINSPGAEIKVLTEGIPITIILTY